MNELIDLQIVWITIKLAALTVVFLFIFGLPLAWWLANTRSNLRPVIESITAMPLVLPPTVLGFYMLVLLGVEGPLGALWMNITGGPLAFTFAGLVIASCFYSLPFVVQPLQTAFEKVDRNLLEAASTLGASNWATFSRIVLPLSQRGVITAAVLGFAHTVGEFGVVLMVGGNIPGVTQVVSIHIYEQVETLNFASAHALSLLLLIFSFLVLVLVYWLNHRWNRVVRL